MRSPHDGPRRLVVIIAITALIVVDIALVWLAIQSGRPAADASPAPTESAVVVPPSPSVPAPTPSNTAVTLPSLDGVRVLAMSSATAGWRAERGACATGRAVLEATVDGGATWTEVPVPNDGTEIAALATVATQPSRLAVISLGVDCVPRYDRTFSGGASWQVDTDTTLTPTFVDADGSLLVGGVSYTVPCAVPLGIETLGSSVAVRCQDDVYVAQAGASWAPTGIGLTLAASSDGADLLVALDPTRIDDVECEGLVVQRFAGGVDAGSPQCVTTPVDGGQVAVTTLDDELWVWSSDAVTRVPLEV